MMKLSDFMAGLELAVKSKTLYVNGAFGAPATAKNKIRYSTGKNEKRADAINAADSDVFFFDCVCLIKGILWGWKADKTKTYGGAVYKSNGVDDIGELEMINRCSKVSSDFSNIQIGEMIYMTGHCGVYRGNGEVIEASPAWANGVQVTKLSQRKWLKHGFLPYVEYVQQEVKPEQPKGVRIYKVVKGDSLWKIARTQLGNALRWPEIQKLNGMKNTSIRINQELKLPEK